MTAPRRRWLAFSLRTMFVVVTILSAAGYWLACRAAVQRQQQNYESVAASWQAMMTAPADVCEASLQLFRAEAAMPFADRRSAAGGHLSRIERVKDDTYGPFSEWLMGVSSDAELAEAHARKAKIDHYYDEAKRLASETR